MSKTYFVNYPCPVCKVKGKLNYYPLGYKEIPYEFIQCGCQCWFKKGDNEWEEMIKNIIERPD